MKQVATIGLIGYIKEHPHLAKVAEEGIAHYSREYMRAVRESNPESAAFSYLLALDKVIEEVLEDTDLSISCKRGCSYCCEQIVFITMHEAKLIASWCEEKGIEIDWGKLERQKKLDQETWVKSVDKGCVFLKGGECSIYEARPMNCRKYFVVSPPRKCNTEKKRSVARFNDFNVEVLVSAIESMFPTRPMAPTLLFLRDMLKGY